MNARRRSSRVVGSSAVESPSFVRLLAKIREDDPEIEVFKVHNFISAHTSPPVIDAILDALTVNTNCQALYIQNVSGGFGDEQLKKLVEVLRRGNIWCLNAGENHGVTSAAWQWFVTEIEKTNVTHAYLSKECVPVGLSEQMQKVIRRNRAKHTRHKSASNIEVIRRCTNMW